MGEPVRADLPPAPSQGPPQAPPRRTTPGIGPAAVVGAIALVLVIGLSVGAVVGGHTPVPAPSSSHPVRVAGTGLGAVPAAAALRPLLQAGEPPSNVVDSLSLPQGVRRVLTIPNTGLAGSYQAEAHFDADASEGALVTFYRRRLAAQGWQPQGVSSVRGEPGATEVLATRLGTDSWRWEVGAIISPTAFTTTGPVARAVTSHAAGHGRAHESTPFVLRLIQEPDAQ